MRIKIYQVDAFTKHRFGGNPAAVCLLDDWLPDALLLKIAQENNLAETAFVRPLSEGRYGLRWFTPEIEMDLCGHATLASAYVIFQELNPTAEALQFETRSGDLRVYQDEALLEMDLPARPPRQVDLPSFIQAGLSLEPVEVWKARDYLLVFEREKDIRQIVADRSILDQINLDPGGIIVTAPGDKVDFVSRFFTPQAAIFEDPVTGSAHCSLIPYWSNRLGKTKLIARQLSPRRGKIWCKLAGDRVFLKGQAVLYLKGEIEL